MRPIPEPSPPSASRRDITGWRWLLGKKRKKSVILTFFLSHRIYITSKCTFLLFTAKKYECVRLYVLINFFVSATSRAAPLSNTHRTFYVYVLYPERKILTSRCARPLLQYKYCPIIFYVSIEIKEFIIQSALILFPL